MERIVVSAYELVVGGPVGKKQVVTRFRQGEVLNVVRIGMLDKYPRMYRIIERPKMGLVSRGVLAKFLDGFDPRMCYERPEP